MRITDITVNVLNIRHIRFSPKLILKQVNKKKFQKIFILYFQVFMCMLFRTLLDFVTS